MELELDEYFKKLEELLAKGLYADEADAVIKGKCTLEEALEQHKAATLNESPDSEYKDIEMETAEDAERIMAEVRRITAERSK